MAGVRSTIILLSMLACLTAANPQQEGADSTHAGLMPAPSEEPLLHYAHPAIVQNRPYLIELFVDIEPDDIEEVLLHLRVDSSVTYTEVSLEGKYGRYQYRLPLQIMPTDTLRYYFVVSQKDYGIWAFPTDDEGEIAPYKLEVVTSTLEYFRRFGNVR